VKGDQLTDRTRYHSRRTVRRPPAETHVRTGEQRERNGLRGPETYCPAPFAWSLGGDDTSTEDPYA